LGSVSSRHTADEQTKDTRRTTHDARAGTAADGTDFEVWQVETPEGVPDESHLLPIARSDGHGTQAHSRMARQQTPDWMMSAV